MIYNGSATSRMTSPGPDFKPPANVIAVAMEDIYAGDYIALDPQTGKAVRAHYSQHEEPEDTGPELIYDGPFVCSLCLYGDKQGDPAEHDNRLTIINGQMVCIDHASYVDGADHSQALHAWRQQLKRTGA